MFFHTIKQAITRRLAIIKYCGCAALHWDTQTDTLKPTNYYVFLTWGLCYYGGILLLPFFYYFLYNYLQTASIQEKDGPGDEMYRNLAACFMATICFLTTFCSLIVCIIKSRRQEVCAFYNGCFSMDRDLKSKLYAKTEKFA